MNRYLSDVIQLDLNKKIVFLSGPRQVGKTTLSKQLDFSPKEYLNFDNDQDRDIIFNHAWDRNSNLVIFDELHKKKNWKRWLKGIYDVEGIPPRIIITGSARLDAFSKAGDSMAGRFFPYRLHPLSVHELKEELPASQALDQIMMCGGFPEPFLNGDEVNAARWRRTHIDRILREDLIDLGSVREIKSIEIVTDLLANQVGSPVSYESLARDLEVSSHTIKHWIDILESMFVVFRVMPYAKNIRRAIRKRPKIYFYDTGFVKGGDGPKFENLIATTLLKRNHFMEDTLGQRRQLHYLRNREKKEVDFLTVSDGLIEWMIESKLSDPDIRSIRQFLKFLSPKKSFVVVKNLRKNLTMETIDICQAAQWLDNLGV